MRADGVDSDSDHSSGDSLAECYAIGYPPVVEVDSEVVAAVAAAGYVVVVAEQLDLAYAMAYCGGR